MRTNIRLIEIFVRVVESGSFVAAARSLVALHATATVWIGEGKIDGRALLLVTSTLDCIGILIQWVEKKGEGG